MVNYRPVLPSLQNSRVSPDLICLDLCLGKGGGNRQEWGGCGRRGSGESVPSCKPNLPKPLPVAYPTLPQPHSSTHTPHTFTLIHTCSCIHAFTRMLTYSFTYTCLHRLIHTSTSTIVHTFMPFHTFTHMHITTIIHYHSCLHAHAHSRTLTLTPKAGSEQFPLPQAALPAGTHRPGRLCLQLLKPMEQRQQHSVWHPLCSSRSELTSRPWWGHLCTL